MRYLALSLVVAALLAATACAGKSSSNSSDQSSSSDQTATTAPMSASTEAATEAPTEASTTTAAGSIPSYPGATSEASGSTDSMGKSESGSVMSTDDSFDKVYAWYQQHLPAGSEKVHTESPQGAVFTVGNASGGTMQSVSISVSQGRTVITVGAVKM